VSPPVRQRGERHQRRWLSLDRTVAQLGYRSSGVDEHHGHFGFHPIRSRYCERQYRRILIKGGVDREKSCPYPGELRRKP
jgi:hypothetical protein